MSIFLLEFKIDVYEQIQSNAPNVTLPPQGGYVSAFKDTYEA